MSHFIKIPYHSFLSGETTTPRKDFPNDSNIIVNTSRVALVVPREVCVHANAVEVFDDRKHMKEPVMSARALFSQKWFVKENDPPVLAEVWIELPGEKAYAKVLFSVCYPEICRF